MDLFKERALTWDHISPIYENSPKIIKIEKVAEPYSLRVTAMDANHIPGSVMFLFEKLGVDGQVELRILYTGDFRASPDMESYPEFWQLDFRVDTLYLDTSYCRPEYDFPNQDDVIQRTVVTAHHGLPLLHHP